MHSFSSLRQAQPETATGYEVTLLLAIRCQPESHNNDSINNGKVMNLGIDDDHDSDSANDTHTCMPAGLITRSSVY